MLRIGWATVMALEFGAHSISSVEILVGPCIFRMQSLKGDLCGMDLVVWQALRISARCAIGARDAYFPCHVNNGAVP